MTKNEWQEDKSPNFAVKALTNSKWNKGGYSEHRK